MTDKSRHSTPPSGMPAVGSATGGSTPPTDEITAPKSEATLTILAALRDLRTEFVGRFEHLEKTTGSHATALARLTNQVNAQGAQLVELSAAQVSVAKSAAAAAEIATQALRKAGSSEDETRKMIESAMTIQKGAIEAAVTKTMKPVFDDVEGLKASAIPMREAVGAIVNELGIEDKTELGRDVKPGEKITPAFTKLENRAKKSTIMQAIIAVGVVAELIHRVLTHL